jgi:hypothetical protein
MPLPGGHNYFYEHSGYAPLSYHLHLQLGTKCAARRLSAHMLVDQHERSGSDEQQLTMACRRFPAGVSASDMHSTAPCFNSPGSCLIACRSCEPLSYIRTMPSIEQEVQVTDDDR